MEYYQVAEGKYLETHKLKTFSDKQDLKFTAQSPLVITKNILKKKSEQKWSRMQESTVSKDTEKTELTQNK